MRSEAAASEQIHHFACINHSQSTALLLLRRDRCTHSLYVAAICLPAGEGRGSMMNMQVQRRGISGKPPHTSPWGPHCTHHPLISPASQKTEAPLDRRWRSDAHWEMSASSASLLYVFCLLNAQFAAWFFCSVHLQRFNPGMGKHSDWRGHSGLCLWIFTQCGNFSPCTAPRWTLDGSVRV